MDAEIALRCNVTMFWTLVDRALVLLNGKLADKKNCTIILNPEVFYEWPSIGEFVREGLLSAKLAITLEDFDLDYFGKGGFSFVSEKMRRAMALGPSDIQYFDVDSSESAPLPRSKSYRTMHVPVTEDVSDLKNSEYLCRHHPDGSLEIISPVAPAFRDNAQPAHEIFADRSLKQVYCTDEFALRVLRAGCSGVLFMHPSVDIAFRHRRFRTLRGIEEIVEWDASQEILHARLVQEIPSKADSAASRGEV